MVQKQKQSKVGAIVLATDQGLGILAKDFYDNGIIDTVYIHPHSSRENHYEWYDNKVEHIDDLLECDTILMFETPFDWKIIVRAREKGVKTVLMPMYECTNFPLPYFPDVVISPSLLDQQYYPESEFVPVPVPKSIKWRKREKASVFVHNAGNGGLGGRNGTKELLEAMKHVKSDIKLIIRSQVPIKEVKDPRIEYRIGQFDDIWAEGDVFIFPEKFNGLSLPIQEAFASGMAVMTSDRFPNNTYLPTDLLIPVSKYVKERTYCIFDKAIIDPIDIAKTIDKWHNKSIEEYSLKGLKFKQEYSWEKLKEIYETVMS